MENRKDRLILSTIISGGLFFILGSIMKIREGRNLKNSSILRWTVLVLAVTFGVLLCLCCILWLVKKMKNSLAVRRCRKGSHVWNGCICMVCGTTNHVWDGCKCTRCGKTRDEGHSWDGCKCTRCGKNRDEGHLWDGCKCIRCGQAHHEWELTGTDSEEYWPEGVDPCTENLCFLQIRTRRHYKCTRCGEIMEEAIQS